MGGKTASLIVDVPPDKFWQVITDYEHYSDFLSSVSKAEVIHRQDNVVRVYFEIDLIKKIKYTLEMVENPTEQLSWSLVEGDLFKENSGSWVLEPEDGGSKTKATYTTELGFTLFVPKMITGKLASVSLPMTMNEFKDQAERL